MRAQWLRWETVYQPRYVCVGSELAAQTIVVRAHGQAPSPFYGKVPPPAKERMGISILKLEEDGTLALLGHHDLDTHVGWMAWHPANGHLYAAGGNQIYSFRVSAADGDTPTLLGTSSAGTVGDTAHVELSNCGAWALVANYPDATLAVLPIHADGAIGAATDSKTCGGVPRDPKLADRQEATHPHQIRLGPRGGRWAHACDLGADRVWVFGFDATRGALVGSNDSERHVAFPAGSGCCSENSATRPAAIAVKM